MSTDYTSAVMAVVAMATLLTGMVAFVLTRPNDAASNAR